MNNSLWAVVPAAGIGRRMASSIPKQYLPLMGKTVIEHTLDRLLQVEALQGVMVAISSFDQQFSQLPIASHPKIYTTVGGAERSDSVLAALYSLQEKLRLSHWVLVHDAVRCCIKPSRVEHLLKATSGHIAGGILAVPARDTLKQVNRHQHIETTIDRRGVWQAQTPQVFRYGLLRDALQRGHEKQQVITDEASAIERIGMQPLIVEGHPDNIKITHPEDLGIAATILQQQKVLLSP
ncbi:MAG: 2-C-methyl-D-erythritol 4-phosphate cytidylyltransferase [Pseudomonadota bacterium]